MALARARGYLPGMIHHHAIAVSIGPIVGALTAVAMSLLAVYLARKRPNA